MAPPEGCRGQGPRGPPHRVITPSVGLIAGTAMRVLAASLVTLCVLLAASPVSADLASGDSKRYVGPLSGVDPCLFPDTEDTAAGGACFKVTLTGKPVLIVVDDAAGVALATYRVLDADGVPIAANDFCGQILTPRLHQDAVRLSVSVHPGVRVDNCAGTAGTGLSGVITVKAVMT